MNTTFVALALVLAAPDEPKFAATGTGEAAHTGPLVALSLESATVSAPVGARAVGGLVSLSRADKPRPAFPTGAQLVSANGERVRGELVGGDAKALAFRPACAEDDWKVPFDAVAAVWLVAPPADTPTDPAKYAWLNGTPPRDVLLYRNGDAARGSVAAFGPDGVTFTADGGAPRTVPFKDLAAVGFNPRFARPRKPKGPYARLTLADGTRFDATTVSLKDGEVVAKPLLGPEVAVPVAKLIALDVLQGGAVYLSDLKPTKSDVSGFVGAGWPWVADRTVRGNPLRVLTPAGESAFDKGIGTHPRTVLTYALNGEYVRFEALVGLDAGTGKRGRATVRVLLDGKAAELPDLNTLTAGPAIPVKLNVTGAKELTLEIDFGTSGDVQADVNWAGARLIRK